MSERAQSPLIVHVGAPHEQYFQLNEPLLRSSVQRGHLKQPESIILDWESPMREGIDVAGQHAAKHITLFNRRTLTVHQSELSRIMQDVSDPQSYLPPIIHPVALPVSEATQQRFDSMYQPLKMVPLVMNEARLQKYLQLAVKGFKDAHLTDRHKRELTSRENIQRHIEKHLSLLVGYSLQRSLGYVLGHELQHRKEYVTGLANFVRFIKHFKLGKFLMYGFYMTIFQYAKMDKLISDKIEKERAAEELRADKTGIRLVNVFKEAIVMDTSKLREIMFAQN